MRVSCEMAGSLLRVLTCAALAGLATLASGDSCDRSKEPEWPAGFESNVTFNTTLAYDLVVGAEEMSSLLGGGWPVWFKSKESMKDSRSMGRSGAVRISGVRARRMCAPACVVARAVAAVMCVSNCQLLVLRLVCWRAQSWGSTTAARRTC